MGKYSHYDEENSKKYYSDRFRKNDNISENSVTREDTSFVPNVNSNKENQNEKKSYSTTTTSKKVKPTVTNLNIRKGPGKKYDRTGAFAKTDILEITETKTGEGSNKGWGKLSSGEGWISLDFCEEIK